PGGMATAPPRRGGRDGELVDGRCLPWGRSPFDRIGQIICQYVRPHLVAPCRPVVAQSAGVSNGYKKTGRFGRSALGSSVALFERARHQPSPAKEPRPMRFMIMHKNDPHTEAGQPPPIELVTKMGAFIGEHAKAGRFVDGAGLAGSKTRTRLVF